MNETYEMSTQGTCEGTPSATSSPGSVAGQLPSASLDGLMNVLSGQVLHRASLSPRQADSSGLLMSGTYGQPSTTSSHSAILQSSLVSRLKRRLDTAGSTLYRMTWKESVTPAGRSVSQLRASVPRTSASESGSSQKGWPTATANDSIRHPAEDFAPTPNMTLNHAAIMAGWPTANAGDPKAGASDLSHRRQVSLPRTAALAGWVTATTRDWKDSPGMSTEREGGRTRLDQLPRQAQLAGWPTAVANDDNKTPEAHLAMKKRMGERDGTGANRTAITSLQVMAKYTAPARLTASGELLTGSSAGMGSGGHLNPAFSLWLMGFPPGWDGCAPQVMQSSRR